MTFDKQAYMREYAKQRNARPEVRAERRARWAADPAARKAERDRQRERHRRHRDLVSAIKVEHGCCDCPPELRHVWPPEALDFDHIDGDTKAHNIGRMLGRRWELIEAEIAKCQVVCANHHRIRTVARLRKSWS